MRKTALQTPRSVKKEGEEVLQAADTIVRQPMEDYTLEKVDAQRKL